MRKEFTRRVMLVEDDRATRRWLGIILEQDGYEVVAAVDGFDALVKLNGLLPDIIVSDLNMPRMSGFEFLAVVRRRFPQIPVIVVSSDFRPREQEGLVIADAFVEKNGSDEGEELLREMDRLIAAGPPRPPLPHTVPAPIWVPRTESGYFVVTCPGCLRTFSIAADEARATVVRACEWCGADVHLVFEPPLRVVSSTTHP